MAHRVTYSNPEGTAPAQGRYSHVGTTNGGKLHFLAGQLAVGADGSVVGRHDFDAQFIQVFKNLGDVLNGLGCDFNDIVRFTTYVVHSQDLEHFHRLRAEHFPNWFKGSDFPPNTLLTIDRLVKEDFLFEVEAIVQARD
ncbi:RidA family protein [Pseudomonas aeruginosa]|nr:RidA family protein [Pseudomonas aeruginosa]